MPAKEQRKLCHDHAIRAFIQLSQMREDVGEIKGMVAEIKGSVGRQEQRISNMEGWRSELNGAAKLVGKLAAAFVAAAGLALGVIKVVTGGQ